jgi:hypothetical protein
LPPSVDLLAPRYRALMDDLNREDIGATMSHYSPAYCHVGSTYVSVQAYWSAIFNLPNFSRRFSDLRVTRQHIEPDGRGYMLALVHIQETHGVHVYDYDAVVEMFFLADRGHWKLIGDGACRSYSEPGLEGALGLRFN